MRQYETWKNFNHRRLQRHRNNAGVGRLGSFWELPIEAILSMIRLNVEAVVRLTHLFLFQMVERGQGRILNTASVAGFEPGPKMATYHVPGRFCARAPRSAGSRKKNGMQ